jgi:hypothetical protein
MAVVEGLDDVKSFLAGLAAGGSARVVRAAVGAAMTVIAQGARDQINATAAPPAVKRAARKLIGKRFSRQGGVVRAKVGFAVGMSQTVKRGSAAYERQTQRYLKKRPGVGLSAADIHWFVLGTKDRFTGARTTRRRTAQGLRYYRKLTGNASRPTGRIDPDLDNVMQAAAVAQAQIASRAAVTKAAEALAREAARRT